MVFVIHFTFYHIELQDALSELTEQPRNGEELEDTKGVIIIRISKNRQHNGQQKKYKRTNNDQQNIHIKLKIE